MNTMKTVFAVCFALVVLASLQCQQKGGVSESTAENKDLIRRQVEVWNTGNLNALDDLMAADLVHHDLPPGMAPGIEGFKQIIQMHRSAFPDIRVVIEDIVAEGDKVVNRWTVSGTHEGDYMGMPPTGKEVTLTGMSFHRIENGKIAEQWHEMDILGLMQQIRSLPPPPGHGDE